MINSICIIKSRGLVFVAKGITFIKKTVFRRLFTLFVNMLYFNFINRHLFLFIRPLFPSLSVSSSIRNSYPLQLTLYTAFFISSVLHFSFFLHYYRIIVCSFVENFDFVLFLFVRFFFNFC